MSLIKTIPWKKAISKLAAKHQFIDPIEMMVRLERFAKPSEIREPVELLRAGAVFHARGLMNAKAIQHNLDWIWPFWVHSQFDPKSRGFLPRAFSITHVNLTHRNWTAVGLPNCQALPIIDPCGLITPFYDGWSIDFWVFSNDEKIIIPSQKIPSSQELILGIDDLSIQTTFKMTGALLKSRVNVVLNSNLPVCRVNAQAELKCQGWLVVALRPFNPEGVSFIPTITLDKQCCKWTINGKPCVKFLTSVEQHKLSDYDGGDVSLHLLERKDSMSINCPVGMATAAAMFSYSS